MNQSKKLSTAFILAAGEGRRMRPLTLDTPKPLLKVGHLSLIEHQILKLKQAGFTRLIINLAYLGDQIANCLGAGENLGVSIVYSREPEPLETGGAIFNALPLLDDEPFVLVNGDVWTDFDFSRLHRCARSASKLHLVMVNNPEHNRQGDFRLNHTGQIHHASDEHPSYRRDQSDAFTFSGISFIDTAYFKQFPNLRAHFKLKEFFDWAIENDSASGELTDSTWVDVGTPERLALVRSLARG